MIIGKEEKSITEKNKKPTPKILRAILVGSHFINSTDAPLSASRYQRLYAAQGFSSTENLVIFQEHHCAILNTFSVATWPASLSLCFREHSLQGGYMKTSLLVFSSSSALQKDQSWQKLDLKVDVLVLCNMTFSSIYTWFGQLHHRLNILKFKDRLLTLFMTPFGCMRLKGRLAKGSDCYKNRDYKNLRGKKTPIQNRENILQGTKEMQNCS